MRRASRRRNERRARGGAALGALVLTALARPESAHAGGERWQELAWVYGSPLLLAVPLAQEDFVELRATWQWSVGGGYMLQPLDRLWILVGGGFEHMILNPASEFVRGSQFRILPEARIGSGKDRLFIYGLVGAGLGLNHVRVEVDVAGDTIQNRRTDGGFNLQLGAGALYHVWDALSVGGELDADLGWYRTSDCDDLCGYATYILGIKAVVGYQF